jgi:hypothetical protein
MEGINSPPPPDLDTDPSLYTEEDMRKETREAICLAIFLLVSLGGIGLAVLLGAH